MASRKRKQTEKRKKDSRAPLSTLADKYRCYGLSVQDPPQEVAFFDARFREFFGRTPEHLREDFCGTFAVCCEWVRSHQNRTAVGVDLDPEPLAWGRSRHLAELDADQRERVELLEQDVRQRVRASRSRPKADVLAAQNFSFWLFRTRPELVDYFRAARSHLAAEGLMVMDMMGGSECIEEDKQDTRKVKGYGKPIGKFTYVWTNARVNPVTNEIHQTIAFRFKDGSRIEPAFEYTWRIWSIPEVREMLAEAGFTASHVYWAETNEDGEETGDWTRVEEAPADPSWVCHLVAVR